MSHIRAHFSSMKPSGRLVMEVVIPARKRKNDNNISSERENTKTPTRPFKRNRNRRMSNNDDNDEEYSPGHGSEKFLASPHRITRRSRRAPSVSSSLAGPSGDQLRGSTPSEPMSVAGSSSSSIQADSLQSLTTAVDFVTDPDTILVDAGDDLRMVTSTSPPPEDTTSCEVKPAFEIDPVHHEIDLSKVSPEPEEIQDLEIDCAICYESMGDLCKKAEEEGKGGIGGGLAIFACEQSACGGSKSFVPALSGLLTQQYSVLAALSRLRTTVSETENQLLAHFAHDEPMLPSSGLRRLHSTLPTPPIPSLMLLLHLLLLVLARYPQISIFGINM